MNTPMQITPASAPPHFSNFYVLAWSAINIAIMIGIVILIVAIIRYVKKRVVFREQLLTRMDILISLLQDKKSDQQ